MRCYYAHPITSYGTKEEEDDVASLTKAGFEVLNPNSAENEEKYKAQGMQLFLDLVDTCDVLAFRPFDDGMLPAGVYKELARAYDTGKPVFEIDPWIGERVLSVDETRVRLKMLGRK